MRKMRARVADEPTGFVWLESGKVAASGYPASRKQVKWAVDQGIGAILTLTMEPLPAGLTEGFGLVLGHVPMVDHGPPQAKSLDEAVAFIGEQKAAGRAVLVHCLAGEGRTGSVLTAYVMKEKGIGAKEALSLVRRSKEEFVEHAQEQAMFAYKPSKETQ